MRCARQVGGRAGLSRSRWQRLSSRRDQFIDAPLDWVLHSGSRVSEEARRQLRVLLLQGLLGASFLAGPDQQPGTADDITSWEL
jgi:hypothetical protein